MIKNKKVYLESGATRTLLYFFICNGCGQDRRTIFKKYADRKICKGCRGSKVDKNQLSLIDATPEEMQERAGRTIDSDIKRSLKRGCSVIIRNAVIGDGAV